MQFDLKFHAVLHQLCKVMLSVQNNDLLRQYVANMLGVATVPALRGKMPLEHRRVFDRYQTVFFALWLLVDKGSRIVEAWRNRAVRYNVLKKDFQPRLQWYQEIVAQCVNWRETSKIANI